MPDNPITQRLARLNDAWQSFTESPEARLLVWQVQPDEASMIQAFWEQENSEAAQTPDLFLRFDAPFENFRAHGYVLRESLIDQYTRATEALREDEPDALTGWSCPYAGKDDTDTQAFAAALASFQGHHAEDARGLGVWLDPSAVPDTVEYLRWLQRLLRALPSEVRLFTVDLITAPGHEPLGKAEPKRVQKVAAQLDMPGALTEISEQAGGVHTPEGRVRHLLLSMGEAAKAGELDRVEKLGKEATDIALKAGWPHLAASPQLLLASVRAGAGKFLEAAEAYSQVYRLGERAEAEPEPPQGEEEPNGYGPRLRLNARLGQVSVLLQLKAYAQTAEAALEASAIAEEMQDLRAQLDALRLASFAYEQDSRVDQAWNVGLEGLARVRKMDDETRETSTAAYLAEGMLRLTEHRVYSDHREPLEKQLRELLGQDWRGSVTQPAASAPQAATWH